MTDQWVTYADAARLTRVRGDLIRQWKRRGIVRHTTIAGRIHVDLAQVRRAEADLRIHGTRPGRRRANVAPQVTEVSH